MTYNEKKTLYESIMKKVAKLSNIKINESYDDYNEEEKEFFVIADEYKDKVLKILEKVISLKISFYKNIEPFPTLRIIFDDYVIQYEFKDSIDEFIKQAKTNFAGMIYENGIKEFLDFEEESSELIFEFPTAASVYETKNNSGHPIDDKIIQKWENKINSSLKTVECCYHGSFGFVIQFNLDTDLNNILLDINNLSKLGNIFKQ